MYYLLSQCQTSRKTLAAATSYAVSLYKDGTHSVTQAVIQAEGAYSINSWDSDYLEVSRLLWAATLWRLFGKTA